jgi:hypothetical protein
MVTWHVAMRPSKRKALDKSAIGGLMEKLEHAKASIRAKFHVVKNLFQHRKARYKGLGKNNCWCTSNLRCVKWKTTLIAFDPSSLGRG